MWKKSVLIAGVVGRLAIATAPAQATSIAELFGFSTPTLQQRRAQQEQQPQTWKQQRFTPAPQPHALRPYGLNGQMGEYELMVLLYLDFSNGQSYTAIKDRFGFPMYRDSGGDYYLIKGSSNRYAYLRYNRRNMAIGYQFSE